MDELDQLFATAKVQTMAPSEGLMARVLADGQALQPTPVSAPVSRTPVPRGGFWSVLAAAVGGRGVLAGLGSVAAAGLLLGFYQPTTLNMISGGYYDTPFEAVDMIPSLDPLLTEG